MNKLTDTKSPVTVDGAINITQATPRQKRIDLKSIDDLRLEMAAVYRAMKAGLIETSDGTKLTYVLGQIGRLIEVHEIEKRIELLENTLLKRKK